MDPIRTTGVRIERHGLGFAAYGPGFYVWDTEPRGLIDDAHALAGRTARPRSARPRSARPVRSVRKTARRLRDPAA